MQDRVPLYPGRVKLMPVSGQENTYDMVRADQPSQVGTPLNKKSLLKDATAALFGLGADAVPDDVLEKIYEIVSPKTEIVYGSYAGNGTSAQPSYGEVFKTDQTVSIGKRPKAVFVYIENGSYNSKQSGGISVLCVDGKPVTYKDSLVASLGTVNILEIIEGGFFVRSCRYTSRGEVRNALPSVNDNGRNYSYVAFV